MDLGVAADVTGQVFRYLLDKFPGRSEEEQSAHSWRRVVALHDIHPCDSRLDSLKLTMFTRTGDAAAKPRSPAECRGLVPVARHLAGDMLGNDEALESTVRSATCRFRKLLRMPIHRPHADILARHGRFATFVAPADSSLFFKDQPRLHMVQELCEMQLPS